MVVQKVLFPSIPPTQSGGMQVGYDVGGGGGGFAKSLFQLLQRYYVHHRRNHLAITMSKETKFT
jgi:hypothetical protein